MGNRKKKKGFGYYLYAVVILLLTITNITLAAFLLTYVQETEVSGTKYSQKSEILEWFEEDKLTINSVYSFWKIRSGSYEMPVYLDDIDFAFHTPWKIELKVTEKQIMAGMYLQGSYVYFDKDGLVMNISSEAMESVELIEGIQVQSEEEIQLFQTLKIQDQDVFQIIMKFIEAMKKQDLSPDKIVWEEESMNLQFGEICVQLGKNNFDEKLTQLPAILTKEELQGQAGILHMEKYGETSGKISFERTSDNGETTDENASDENSQDGTSTNDEETDGADTIDNEE